MFTGIIQAAGIVRAKKRNLISIKINSKIARTVPVGGSVSVDGVCLTALPLTALPRTGALSAWQRQRNCLYFELMNSTLQRTTLGKLKIGAIVNIEPALLAGQPLGGHFVSGHVDGVGVVHNWEKPYLTINVSKRLIKYIIPQGSVAVNGVSLTIVGVKKNSFSVALTGYTLVHTNLANIQKNDKVNIEADLLAKYVKKLCTP